MVKRYTFRIYNMGGFDCFDDAAKPDVYVLASDYDALKKELDDLREESSEADRMITGFVNRITVLKRQYLELAQERDSLRAALWEKTSK